MIESGQPGQAHAAMILKLLDGAESYNPQRELQGAA